jgi:hypothetical protein
MPLSKDVEALLPAVRSRRIFAIGGPPAAASIFAVHLCGEMLRHSFAAALVAPANSLGDVDADAVEDADAVLLFFDIPDENVATFIAQEHIPAVLIEEDFERTAHYCMSARQMGHVDAIRFLTQSRACLDAFAQLPGLPTVRPRECADLLRLIDRLAEALGIAELPQWPLARDRMAEAYGRFASVDEAINHFIHMAAEADAAASVVEEDVATLLGKVAKGYGVGTNSVARHLEWPAELLMDGTPPHTAVVGTMDVTGPARLLTFGPYLHLPAGRWAGQFLFETGDNASSNRFMFDIMADRCVRFSALGNMSGTGRFAIASEFEVRRAKDPVEFRTFLTEGAIEGFFRPIGIELHRVG